MFACAHQLREVLTAIEIPGNHINADGALNLCWVVRILDAIEKRRVIVDHDAVAPDFQASTSFIIDQEEDNTVVFREITDRDVLFVSSIIGERECVVVKYFEKARRSAAMLHVRPSLAVGGADEKAVNLGDIRNEFVIQALAGRLCSLELCAMLARAVARLCGFDGGRKCQSSKSAGHARSPCDVCIDDIGSSIAMQTCISVNKPSHRLRELPIKAIYSSV